MARSKKCSSKFLDAMGPVQDALYVISGKWKLLILISLSNGNKRFTEIEKSIPKLSSKVLAKELKDLEENKLIKRNVYEDYPVSITYTLTAYASTIDPVIKELYKWGVNHRIRIIKPS